MRISQLNILSRKIIVAFVALVVILAIVALFVRDNITTKLEKISDVALSYNKINPDDALILLRQAEDNFQQSLTNTNSRESLHYKTKLLLAFNKIDTLLKQNTDTAHLTANQMKQAGEWYQKKVHLSKRLLVLKNEFDSLLNIYAEYNLASEKKPVKITVPSKQASEQIIKKTDTVKKIIETGKRKGLFGRIKDAIANKPNTTTGIIEINHENQKDITSEEAKVAASGNDKIAAKKLQRLQQSYGNLLEIQKRLILLNSSITNELERIVSELREINSQMTHALKDVAFKSYKETTSLLNKFYLVALFLILLFAILLIVFIFQLNKSELRLRKENDRSIVTARQKMDLLLHMSHEIRNPLTAIQGLLSVFGKTSLSERQAEMLKSIRRSSDMLLRTLNDTLDAAKMENSELKLHLMPFNPHFSIQQVVESMSYSAEKKKLSLTYSFAGDKNALILGDEFRLKQILVNLLSNAIKFTPNGGITLQAKRENSEALHIAIIDTGTGISADQIPNLFSKYYQTNSSNGKVGTGLGLYICKQLVEMQGGKISVKSDPASGTTFSFVIPYSQVDQSQLTQSTDPLIILNGISILAVDDNEMNLMFLKILMAKWNVKFYQALSGKEALDIISTASINIVLTDIQMPEMDGKQLLAAIGSLPSPLHSIPVISMSGLSEISKRDDVETDGFSGSFTKPFVESEIANELIRVLNNSFKRG